MTAIDPRAAGRQNNGAEGGAPDELSLVDVDGPELQAEPFQAEPFETEPFETEVFGTEVFGTDLPGGGLGAGGAGDGKRPFGLDELRLTTQRGLLVAGCLCAFILFAVMMARPSPAGQTTTQNRDQNEEQADAVGLEPAPEPEPESGISAETLTSEAPSQGGSSRPAPTPLLDGALDGPAYPPAVIPYLGDVFEVANVNQWNSALASAGPGDVIKLVANINQPLQYRGSRYQPDRRNGPDGTAAAPITITAADGVWIDPGNKSNTKPALDIMFTTNVNVIGVGIRNSQFGIRILQSSGTQDSPIVIANNTITDIGHAAIHVGANFDTREPSRFVRVQGNTITRTGQIAPEFGEGIYLGYGTKEWIDQSSNIEVLSNDISYVTAEGIDIKPGVKHVLVADNRIHDLSPRRGGAITASYVATGGNPNPSESIDIQVRDNWIWNMNLDGAPGSNDWAIWVGHGGVTIEGNVVWGLRGNAGQTRAVRVRSPHDFGPHRIVIANNTFWTATGWLAEGTPSAAGLVSASGNRGPSGTAGIEVPLSQPSGAPNVGSGGTADSGEGPGSAFNP